MQNVFKPEKIMHSPRQMEELLGMSGWICLNSCIIHLLLMVFFVYLVFYLMIDFLAELVRFLTSKILNLYCTGIMQYFIILLLKNMQANGVTCFYFSYSSSITLVIKLTPIVDTVILCGCGGMDGTERHHHVPSKDWWLLLYSCS